MLIRGQRIKLADLMETREALEPFCAESAARKRTDDDLELLDRANEDIADRAFYPLTLPLTVGPGSISVALTIGANRPPHENSIVRLLAAIIGPALIAVTIYLSYRFAHRIAHFLGETAMNVFVRLTSFILLCIGVQILWNGIHSLLSLPR